MNTALRSSLRSAASLARSGTAVGIPLTKPKSNYSVLKHVSFRNGPFLATSVPPSSKKKGSKSKKKTTKPKVQTLPQHQKEPEPEVIIIKILFPPWASAIAREKKQIDMIAKLDECQTLEEIPIWISFQLWQYGENMRRLKNFLEIERAECCGNDIADMKMLFDYHGMGGCLDCFMLDECSNMRTIGYIIDDDILVSFSSVLPYMTQYYAGFSNKFYGKSPAHNARIRQWVNYCVRNIRGRKISEYMWGEMEIHLGREGYFGGTYRTMADTLLYFSLYPRLKGWSAMDFAKRYNIARWFRLMQQDPSLRGPNLELEISRTSPFHPNYPFYGLLPDPADTRLFEKAKNRNKS